MEWAYADAYTTTSAGLLDPTFASTVLQITSQSCGGLYVARLIWNSNIHVNVQGQAVDLQTITLQLVSDMCFNMISFDVSSAH